MITIINITYFVVAVRRKYEGVRRQWLDEEKEEHDEIMSQRMKKKKYASRLQRVCLDASVCLYDYSF